MKVTSSVYNESNPSSGGSAEFSAQGLLQTNQTEIISTRNGRTVIGSVSGNRQISRRGERLNSRNVDTDAPPIPQPTPPPIPTPLPIPVESTSRPTSKYWYELPRFTVGLRF